MKTALSILLSFAATLAMGQDCSDLFISEYVRGSGNNAALELYNPTPNAIDLSTYSVGRFRDGSGTPMLLSLSGTIQPYDTYVVTLDKRDPNGTGFEQPISPILEALSDTFVNPVYVQANSPFYFNGDDAVPLFNGDPNNPSNLIDLIGRIGEDPGTAWSDANGVWWTTDHTLYRKPTVLHGDSDGLDVFMVEAEWDSLPEDDFSGLGWHNCLCGSAANVVFAPSTASICDEFGFGSHLSEMHDIGPIVVEAYYDTFRIIDIIDLPAGITAETDVMNTADVNGPYGYWSNSGIPPNQSTVQGTLSMSASQATINGLLNGGPNNDGIYPIKVVVDKRIAMTVPDISFIVGNGTWTNDAPTPIDNDTVNISLQIENCGGQPCVSIENVLFAGLNSNYTVNDSPQTLLGAPSGGVFIGPGINGDSFDPNVAGIGSHGISYVFLDGNGCVGAYSLCTDVSLTVGGGNNDLDQLDVSVYPNPSTGAYALSMPDNLVGSAYSIHAYDGGIIDAGVINKRLFMVNIEAQSAGNYLLSIQTPTGVYEKSLIKVE